MAKLLAYYNLCPINNIEDFLGLSRDVDLGCVINTLGRNIILVVKLSNQRQVRSWTVLDRLSSKVVYDFNSERYVGVFGGRYLRFWEREQNDLNAVKKIKLYRVVQDLFTVASGQTLVLYKDGTCESLESALETRNRDRMNPAAIVQSGNVDHETHTIQDVQVLTLDDGSPLLTYYVRNGKDDSTELNYALLGKSDLKVVNRFQKIKLERIGDELQLAGRCIVDSSEGPSLITLWSDGRLFILQLSLGQSPKQQEGVGNFFELVQSVDVSQPLSMASVGKDCIAIYANNSNRDGATLALFNVQFKVFQAKQYFKVYFRASRIWVVESNILLACGETLAVVPFKISKEQLSDLIGSQRTFDLSSTIDDESINDEAEFCEGYTFGGSLPPVEEVKEEDDDPEDEPSPLYHQYASEQDFEATLRQIYRESLPIEVVHDATQEEVQLKLFNNPDPILGPLVLSEKCELIAEEMERSGYSELDICDKIVPLMIKANLSNDIAKCLKRYSVVSERLLVQTLKYAMSLEFEATDENSEPDVNELNTVPEAMEPLASQNVIINAQKTHPSRRDFLNVVLSCSFNRSSLIPIVRGGIDFTTVLKLLQHLEYLLVDPMATLSETLHNGDRFDSDEKTVEWIMVLLDSHYQQFLLSKDDIVLEQLRRILAIVDGHIGSLRQLKSFVPELQHIVERKKGFSSASTNKWYTVETIQLY
ncbi:nucleolar protein 11 [Anopheles cruzii]|uniref:nucleolar protein 11 n=1 Tax=Anopheles cruzii TaxID=68878 RepID=UPI0022EC50FB|nr:nucleolar protein 11 [Anopheles cruzii]